MKSLRFPSDDKELDAFNERLMGIERKYPTEEKAVQTEEEKETERQRAYIKERESKCHALREARVMRLVEDLGYNYSEALQYADCEISDYELGWILEKKLAIPPAERYRRKKEHWHSHETSWCAGNADMNDENYCNAYRCVPECRYFEPEGVITDEEIKLEHEKHWAERKRCYEEEYKRIIYLPRDTRMRLGRIINRRQEEFMFTFQHIGWPQEAYDAIKKGVYNQYFAGDNAALEETEKRYGTSLQQKISDQPAARNK